MRPGPEWPGRVFFLLIGLVGFSAVFFSLITWQVVVNGPLLRTDQQISRALLHPDQVSELLAGLGNVQVAVPLLAAVLLGVAWRGRSAGADRWWLGPLGAAVSMVLVPVLVVPFKEWTARHGTAAVPPGTGYFPSGHTATAAVAYGAAALVLLPWLRTATARRALVTVCAALVLGASYGLVRRGYHWPLDVVASWCLSAVLLSTLWLLISGLGRSRRRSSSGTASSRSSPS
ncbi:phosphatase PAP2 family protein [Streptomyces kebangsaanensis]|uniref:phosphatase PAP2 family protein n=1 Tax=Streptomyces kebangsaanensis TaxID=864058 RepID=UPI0009A0F3D7|nr:phosphatase PAP2 family protein [Streptomyces kebangsaanensis]